MTKKEKTYKILTLVFGLAFVGLLLIMGITAIQKSMNLKIAFDVKPQFQVMIEYKESAGGTYSTLFCNNPDSTEIADGFILNGNQLIFNQEFTALGVSIDLKITNLNTDTALQVTPKVGNVAKTPIRIESYTSGNGAVGMLTGLTTTDGAPITLIFEKAPETLTLTLDITLDRSDDAVLSEMTDFVLHVLVSDNTDSFYACSYNQFYDNSFAVWTADPSGNGTYYSLYRFRTMPTGGIYPKTLAEGLNEGILDPNYTYIEKKVEVYLGNQVVSVANIPKNSRVYLLIQESSGGYSGYYQYTMKEITTSATLITKDDQEASFDMTTNTTCSISLYADNTD